MSENNGFGPLYVARNDNVLHCGVVFMAVFAMCGSYGLYQEEWMKDVKTLAEFGCLLCGIIVVAMTGEMLKRFSCVFEELLNHRKTRYRGNFMDTVKSCLAAKDNNLALMIVYIISIIILFVNQDTVSKVLPLHLIPILSSIICLANYIFARNRSLVEVSLNNENSVHNLAAALAWSYYTGYLKIILPHLNEMINNSHGPNFQKINDDDLCNAVNYRKLIVIIPKSCICYKSLKDIDQRIKDVCPLSEKRLNRGGVMERIYKVTLNKVTKEGKDMYVIAEYASSIMTMRDMRDNAKAEFTQEDIETQGVLYYNKLKDLLESDPDCRNNVELVLFNGDECKLADVLYDVVESNN